jgi:multidrug efflux pump subunit AcrB
MTRRIWAKLVLAWRDGQPVRLADLATVEMRPPERQFFSYQNGNPAIGLRIVRAPGANVLSTLDQVKKVAAELREGPLKERGLGIEQSFDASVFINRAVNLLVENLVVGALLALACVWWFMRDVRATVLIASTIPVCLLATFCVLDLAGSQYQRHLTGRPRVCGRHGGGRRDRRLRQHHPAQGRRDADRTGRARRYATGRACVVRVDGDDDCCIPASAVLKDVEGQIFADLALTIAIAVAFSIVVAITVVPAAAGRWLGSHSKDSGYGAGWPWLTDRVIAWTRTRKQQLAWVGALLVAPLLLSWMLLPKLDYLPPVKRAAIDAYFSFPPGHEPGGRQSRDRAHAAQAHGAVHEGREGAAPQELVRAAVAERRHDRRARYRRQADR